MEDLKDQRKIEMMQRELEKEREHQRPPQAPMSSCSHAGNASLQQQIQQLQLQLLLQQQQQQMLMWPAGMAQPQPQLQPQLNKAIGQHQPIGGLYYLPFACQEPPPAEILMPTADFGADPPLSNSDAEGVRNQVLLGLDMSPTGNFAESKGFQKAMSADEKGGDARLTERPRHSRPKGTTSKGTLGTAGSEPHQTKINFQRATEPRG